MTVPYVIEPIKDGQERTYDLYSRMMKDRIVFIRGMFDDDMANSITAQLLFLESIDDEKDIYMYINSPGGLITSMYAIYDVMNYIKPDISTIAYGQAGSAASFILAAGTKNKRYALPNCCIMIHELSSGNEGKFHSMENNFNYTRIQYERMAKHYSKFTGKSLSKIKKDMKLDYFMSAEEAKDYGLIDMIHDKR